MLSHPQLIPLVQSFLQHLEVEERLLQEAVTVASELYAALRKGHLAPLKTAQPRQEQLATSLRIEAERREAAALRLAGFLGLRPDGLNLSALADRLPEPTAQVIRAQRERLAKTTAQLEEFQQRNANLIHHLRSYIRGVLSALTKTTDVPTRYGSSGARLNPRFGTAILARG